MKKDLHKFLREGKEIKEEMSPDQGPDLNEILGDIIDKVKNSGGLSSFMDQSGETDEESSDEYFKIMDLYKIMRKVNPEKADELLEKAREMKGKGNLRSNLKDALM